MPQALPKAIFFDWDGTLVDTYAFLEQAHNTILLSFGLPPMQPGGFARYFGAQRETIYKSLYGSFSEDAKRLFEAFVHEHYHTIKAMPGAEKLLQKIDALNIVSGVISNKKSLFINEEIDVLGWRNYFSAAVGAGEALRDKPHADPLLLGLKRAGLSPDRGQIWYVGDTSVDLQCAQNAGCRAIFIGNAEKAAQAAEGLDFPWVYEDCNSFAVFLSSLADTK